MPRGRPSRVTVYQRLDEAVVELRERLLDEGKAVGSKSLRDYMEVRGYGDAARWVYGQALEPGEWNNGELLTLHEVRSVHHMAMTPVWTVDPHPHAADAEGPGCFRRHEIAQFPGGMKPPPWNEIDPLMRQWTDDVNALRESSGEPFSGSAGARTQRLRACSSVFGRKRENRPPVAQLAARPSGISARHHLQARSRKVPQGHASSRLR